MISTSSDNIVHLLGSTDDFHATANVASDYAPAIRFRHHLWQLIIDTGTPAVIIEATLSATRDGTTVPDAEWFPVGTLNSSTKYLRLTNACLAGVRARRADSTTNGVKVIYSGCGDLTDN